MAYRSEVRGLGMTPVEGMKEFMDPSENGVWTLVCDYSNARLDHRRALGEELKYATAITPRRSRCALCCDWRLLLAQNLFYVMPSWSLELRQLIPCSRSQFVCNYLGYETPSNYR